MDLKVVQFVAILLTALAVVPGGAHVLELPNKIRLPQEAYFSVQQIYRGWAFVGIVLLGAIVADFYLAFLLRDQRPAFLLGLAGALCVAASLLVFFVWVFPANEATDNWVSTPPNWQVLRQRWEYGHAAGAALIFTGFCLIVAATLSAGSQARGLPD